MPRILAVDDEPNIMRLICVTLERRGYQVESAATGTQALDRIRKNRPDLLVSDVMMPEMDGFELVRTLRSDPDLTDLPIIMLTARGQDKDIMEGFRRGADMYLTKPFNPVELLSFVDRLLAVRP
ncbi:MAG: response regulator [Capsulimonadales bacterium]|nr:response regulator [Capsulimonadales bacterium]